MVWVDLLLSKVRETQANRIVLAVRCYQKLGNSGKYNGLGCFLLSKLGNSSKYNGLGVFFVIQS